MEFNEINKSNYSLVKKIYQDGIDTGNATFELEAPDWEKWNNSHLTIGRLALFEKGLLIGWAALSPVSSRCVYEGVAEVSVYVAANSRGKGIGKKLLNGLIEASEKEGFWTLQAGIMSENKGSINLHKSCGFREIGFREKIANLKGTWLDNVLMERRSKVVGIV